MGNKKDGVDKMKLYAMASIVYQVVVNIYNVIAGIRVSTSGIVISLIISGLVLFYVMTNKDVKAYQDSL